MLPHWHRNCVDKTRESWNTGQCCPPSPFLAVPCNSSDCVSFRAFVFAVRQFMRSHAALLKSKGRDWKSHQFQFETFSLTLCFFLQQSVPQAWALVVWWLTLLSRVSWYWDSFFCFTTDFLCPWESHLIYCSLNTTEKTMLFFLRKGIEGQSCSLSEENVWYCGIR